jgi:transcriptional repressor NrdR
MEELVDDIEKQLLNTMRKEVTSSEIGEILMERLKELDQVAYVRFASVYKEFKDVDTFMEELKKIIKKN